MHGRSATLYCKDARILARAWRIGTSEMTLAIARSTRDDARFRKGKLPCLYVPRLMRAAQQVDADLVMLTGDSHNAWAYSLAEEGRTVGVEFGETNVTLPGLETDFTQEPLQVARNSSRPAPSCNGPISAGKVTSWWR